MSVIHGANEQEERLHRIASLINPASVAIIGASNTSGYGARVVENLRRGGFAGPVYPVNPKYQEIQGLRAYSDVRQIDGRVDLAVVVVPAAAVAKALDGCGEKGVRACCIISSGFAERGPVGLQLEQQVLATARRYGIRFSGPNSIGVLNSSCKLFASASIWPWDHLQVPSGAISIISQSGALAFTSLLSKASERGVGIRSLISVGNQADLTAVDFVEYFIERDSGTRAVGLLLEGLRENDGRRLLEVAARAAELGKSIVVLKIGRSALGERAARSHTASLTGNDAICNGCFRQGALARVEDLDELWETADFFAKTPRPNGGVAVLSNSGGFNALFADSCGAYGVPIAELSAETMVAMERALEGMGHAGNPADLSGKMARQPMGGILDLLNNEPGVGIVVLGVTRLISGASAAESATSILSSHARSKTPYMMLWASKPDLDARAQEAVKQIHQAGIPSFHEAVKGAKGLARLYEHHAARQMLLAQASETETSHPSEVEFDIAAANIFQSLDAAGIPAPRSFIVTDEHEAIHAAKEIGYPVVLKTAARTILHRTELGGVVLQITGERELHSAFVGLAAKTKALGADNRFFVQEYVANGVEMILGGLRDPAFGPVVMLGTGGIWVEILQDAVFRAAPIGRQMAQTMVDELKGRSLLVGYRGKPRADRAALVQAIVTFSKLFAGMSTEICTEIEINPLVVLPEGKGVCALDIKVQDQKGSMHASAR